MFPTSGFPFPPTLPAMGGVHPTPQNFTAAGQGPNSSHISEPSISTETDGKTLSSNAQTLKSPNNNSNITSCPEPIALNLSKTVKPPVSQLAEDDDYDSWIFILDNWNFRSPKSRRSWMENFGSIWRPKFSFTSTLTSCSTDKTWMRWLR